MKSPRQGGFPLAALFLLVAGVALLMAGPGPAVARLLRQEGVVLYDEGPPRPWAWRAPVVISVPLVAALVVGAVLGAILGTIVGCTAERHFRGAVLGFFTGGVVGVLAMLHLIVEPNFLAVVAGSALLVAGSVVYRFAIKQPDPEVTPENPPGTP